MDLISVTDPRSPVSEAYRALRTNLSFYSLDNPVRTLVVAASAADDGAAETAANLAVTMAQGGHKTILVDCDLRRPSLHTLFDLKSEPGFTSMIVGDGGDVGLMETAVDNLRLLPSGPIPPNPADLLGSSKVDEIIATLAETAEIVIFSAPPVIAVTDSVVLGAKVDGVLLVIQAGKTRREHAERAKETLAKANVRVIGATLTNAPKDGSVNSYYSE